MQNSSKAIVQTLTQTQTHAPHRLLYMDKSSR